MKRYFIYLAYDGTRYHGWQIQPNGISVQETIQKCLSILLRQPIEITGAGRTDAGVHARLMVAHFDRDASVDTGQLTYRLNKMLPQDISIYRIEPVSEEMHARFSAVSRTYRYYIHTSKNPFERHYSHYLGYKLDFPLMNQAAHCLLNVEDFKAFCKAGADVKTTLCHVTQAKWVQTSSTTWYFEITANRFLRNMVRAVVGTLIDVGRGKITLDQFKKIVLSGTRSDAGESMPGNALFLEDIQY
jgi:tRNA pseudouridine38-40 synthase